jgi:hypothetical protein
MGVIFVNRVHGENSVLNSNSVNMLKNFFENVKRGELGVIGVVWGVCNLKLIGSGRVCFLARV